MARFVDPGKPASRRGLVDSIWDRLSRIESLEFRATPGPASQTRWHGRGLSHVAVERLADGCRFTETGQFWPARSTTPVAVRNTYLWRREGNMLLLSHERRRPDAPVFLLRLRQADDATLKSEEAHQCGGDRYRATLSWTPAGFRLDWIIHGPRKDERLSQDYRMAKRP